MSTTLSLEDAFLALTFLPSPRRPVKDIALLTSDGRRYGGFTSEHHARWVAQRMGESNYRTEPANADLVTD